MRAAIAGFRGQSAGGHLLVVLGGAALCAATYVAGLDALGGLELAYVTGGHPFRLRAALTAEVVTSTYFGIQWTRARGGPTTNFFAAFFVPLGTPGPVAYLAGARTPDYTLFTSYGDLILICLVAIVPMIGIMTAFERFALEDRAAREAWHAEHFPDAVLEEYDGIESSRATDGHDR